MARTPPVKRKGPVVPVPSVHKELPEELRLEFQGGADPVLTSDRITPVALDPLTSSSRRLWAAPGLEHLQIITTAFGVSQRGLSSRQRRDEDLQVDAAWGIEDGYSTVPTRVIGVMLGTENGVAMTRKAMPAEDIARLVPEAHRAAFVAEGRRRYGRGKIPGGVLDALDEERVFTWKQEKTPEDFVRYGLGNAMKQDGINLGRRQRGMCGAWTLERRLLDKSPEVRALTRMHCRSHRCPRCAPLIAAQWAAEIQRQVDMPVQGEVLGSLVPKDHYVLLTLTLARKGYQNAATACKLALSGDKGPWRGIVARLRRRFPDLAYLRVVEFHKDGWPHVHLLIRSHALVESMLAEARLSSVEALRSKLIAVKAENDRRKAEGRASRLPSPYAKLKAGLRDLAVAAGWGRVDFGFVLHPKRIGAELAKARQCNPDMPRGVRRFQASGKAGDGKPGSFFEHGAGIWVKAPIPPEDTSFTRPPGAGVVGHHEVREAEGVPLVPLRGDVHPGQGHLRVRIETAYTDECAIGERFVLGLRILEPDVLAHGRLRCTVPFAHESDVSAMLRSVAGITLHPSLVSFPPEWLIGKEGWVLFAPRATAKDWDEFQWVSSPGAPPTMAPEIKSEIPLSAFDTATGPTLKAGGRLVEAVIHRAPLEAVVTAYAQGRPDIRFCGARAIAAVDADGTLVRRLTACQEAPRARQGAEALADYLDLLRALQALGPPDVRAANDLGAIVAGVKALMAELEAKAG